MQRAPGGHSDGEPVPEKPHAPASRVSGRARGRTDRQRRLRDRPGKPGPGSHGPSGRSVDRVPWHERGDQRRSAPELHPPRTERQQGVRGRPAKQNARAAGARARDRPLCRCASATARSAGSKTDAGAPPRRRSADWRAAWILAPGAWDYRRRRSPANSCEDRPKRRSTSPRVRSFERDRGLDDRASGTPRPGPTRSRPSASSAGLRGARDRLR